MFAQAVGKFSYIFNSIGHAGMNSTFLSTGRAALCGTSDPSIEQLNVDSAPQSQCERKENGDGERRKIATIERNGDEEKREGMKKKDDDEKKKEHVAERFCSRRRGLAFEVDEPASKQIGSGLEVDDSSYKKLEPSQTPGPQKPQPAISQASSPPPSPLCSRG